MKKYALGYTITLLLGLSLSYSTIAQEPSLRSDRPDSYTVVQGDTLWDISQRFLEDAWRWKEIWQGNSQIANPDLIYPGDTIRLVFIDGKPQLVVNSDVPASQPTAPTNTYSSPTSSKKPLKTIKLSPKVHSSSIKTAIPAIPLDKINKFLLRNRVVEESVLSTAPHIIAGQESRVILSAGDTIYARGKFPQTISSYGIYRKGQSYIDPETKEVLGTQAIDVGAANIQALSKDVGTFSITRSTNEARIGDRLIPSAERQITSTFLPAPPQKTVKGTIMAVERGVSQAGKLEIVVINLGQRDALEPGNVLAIYKRGANIRDRFAQEKTPKAVELPNVEAGLMMVFEVFEKMSLAIILEAEKGAVIGDMITNP